MGLGDNGAPEIVEYKRGTDAGVINRGLVCVAGDFTRYDVHAVRGHRRVEQDVECAQDLFGVAVT